MQYMIVTRTGRPFGNQTKTAEDLCRIARSPIHKAMLRAGMRVIICQSFEGAWTAYERQQFATPYWFDSRYDLSDLSD